MNWSRRTSSGLLVVLALVLLAGGILDRFSPESPFGRRGDFPARTGPLSVADLALDSIFDERYGFALALRDLAPGAAVYADPSVLNGFFRENVLSIALAESVERTDLKSLEFPMTEPTRSGPGMNGWEISVLEGSGLPSTMLARRDERGRRLVDARMVTDWEGQTGELTSPPAGPRRPLVAGLVDSSVLIGLLLIGGLVLPRAGLLRRLRLPLALVTGVAMQIVVGLLLLPGLTSLFLVGAGAVAFGWAMSRRSSPTGWQPSDIPALGLIATVIIVVSVWVRASGFTWASPDSITYLSMAKFLSEGLDWRPSFKRQVGQQSIHALGFALGVEGIHSLGPVLLAAALGIVLAIPAALRRADRYALILTATICAGVLANRWIVLMAAYINSHLVVGVLLLSLAVLLGLEPTESDRDDGTRLAAGITMSALVLLRPEGPFLAALMLVGTLRRGLPIVRSHWWALGAGTVAWYWLLGRPHRILLGESAPARIVVIMLLMGLLFLLVPAAAEALRPSVRHQLPFMLALLLWSTTFVLLFGGFENISFLAAIIANLGEGWGRWGLAGPMLLLLAVLVIALQEQESDGRGVLAARWALIGFVPILLLSRLGDGLQTGTADLTVMLGGGGRIGWGDSVNRMWMHGVFLVLMLFILRASNVRASDPTFSGRTEEADSSWKPRDRGIGGWTVYVAGAASIAYIIASLWNPFYAGSSDSRSRALGPETLLLATFGDEPLGEMTDGASVTQQLFIDLPSSLFDSEKDVEVCTSMTFVTFVRTNAGTVELDLSFGDARATRSLRASNLRDWGQETICLRTSAADIDRNALTLTVSSAGAPPGRAVSLLKSASSATDLDVTFLPLLVKGLGGAPGERVNDEQIVLQVDLMQRRAWEFLLRDPIVAAIVRSTFLIPSLPWFAAALVVLIVGLGLMMSQSARKPGANRRMNFNRRSGRVSGAFEELVHRESE